MMTTLARNYSIQLQRQLYSPEVPEVIPVGVKLTVVPAVCVAPVVAKPDIIASISKNVT